MSTPNQSKRAHDALHAYRLALADAHGHSQALASAVGRAKDAATHLQPLVASPIPVLEWQGGAPPVGDWIAGQDDLVAAVKAGLSA